MLRKQRAGAAACAVALIKIDHTELTKHSMLLRMAETQTLTPEEFASLLRVSDLSAFREPPAVIRTEHQARLIALGYLVDLDGKLHMTTLGRYRIYAGQLTG